MVRVYCEGEKNSYDRFVLNKIIDGVASDESPPDIRPIGGKRGMKSIMEYYENHVTAAKADFYLLFRDRDFDCEIPQREELIFDGKSTYFSYRTTVENYLLDVRLFYSFMTDRKLNERYGIRDENDVKSLFIESAKEIKDYQAVRHALGKLRHDAGFGTTWTEGSGVLPKQLDMSNCRKEAWKMVREAKKETEEWAEEKLDEAIACFSARFTDDFFNNLDFLVWFQGKDFVEALKNTLENRVADCRETSQSFPVKAYFSFAKDHFGDYTKTNSPDNRLYPDLVELRNIIVNKKHK
jgi:hypothetical protein